MKEGLKQFLSLLGIRNQYDAERHTRYSRIKHKMNEVSASNTSSASVLIIFSKDRALQLEALLRTYYDLVKNPMLVFVLYSASSQKFEKSYNEVEAIYASHKVSFIAETNFKNDLVALFSRLTASKVMFLVDDLFFKNPIDFTMLDEVDPKKNVFTLRMGNHLNYAYTYQQKQKIPALEPHVSMPHFLTWKWDKASYDWAYPLSVDGHLFDFNELKVMVNELNYKAPNSFEEALQIMYPLFSKRPGLCLHHSFIINNPCNKVQVENENIAGEIDVEELNRKWEEGYRIDYKKYYGIINNSAHEELELNFVKR